MGVDSYLELFTTSYGWTIANMLYAILLDSGLVFVPLIVVIIRTWLQAHEDGSHLGGVEWAVRKMEVELMVAIFVMATCLVPFSFTSLDRTYLTFTPDGTLNNPTPTAVTGGSSGTGYDAAFASSGNGSIAVPLWWYTVMGISSGVNAATRAGVANQYLGLRQAEEMARLLTIEDPKLRAEAQLFREQCWVPAHAKFHDPNTTLTTQDQITLANSTYGKDDTEWIGSHIFQENSAYYPSFRAQQVVAGFTQGGDGDDADASPDDTEGSLPNCLRWWTDSSNGLRGRLMNSGTTTADTVGNYFFGIWNSMGLSTPANATTPTLDTVKDQILKQALWKSHSNFVQTDPMLGGHNNSRWDLPELLSGIGIASKSMDASFSYYPVKEFVTLAQPLVLMAMYIFLPLVMMLSCYSLQAMMTGAIGIFTVKFWAAMFTVAKYVDERMVVAMYGDSTSMVREYLNNGLDGGAKRMILNVLTLGLFFVIPMVWSGMMAWIGFKVSHGLNSVLQSAINDGKRAGESASKTVTGAAQGIVSGAAKTIGKVK